MLSLTAAASREPGRHNSACSAVIPATGTVSESTRGAGPTPAESVAPVVETGLPSPWPGSTSSVDSNLRARLDAATEVTQGTEVGEPTVEGLGPLFPAELATNTPASAAKRNARSAGPMRPAVSV